MANPETELVWGGYGWKPCQKRIVKPHVQAAVELATLAVEDIGIKYNEPKRAHVRRCGRAVICRAASGLDTTNFELYIRQDLVKHRKIESLCVDTFTAAGHEIVHGARAERYDIWDLAEEVASEGLAHAAEDLLRSSLSVSDELGYFGDNIDINSPNIAEYKQYLQNDLSIARNNERRTDDLIDKWFDFEADVMDLGTVLGLVEVYKRLVEGHTITELIEWPADQILDLRVA